MSILDQILNRTGKDPIPVPTPEWPDLDGRLAIRRLSPTERVALDMQLGQDGASEGVPFTAAVATACAVIMPEALAAFDPGDWKRLVDDPGSGAAIDRLFEVADETNCISAAARGRLKKTSATPPASGSTSESPIASE